MHTDHPRGFGHDQRGIALVLALLLTSVMSVLAVSLMFLSQTETYASMNYRMMSQGRFAGEAAIHKASAFLTDPAQYTVPGTMGSDPLSNYNRTVSPVTYNGQPVILSATPAKASNYPVLAVRTAFNNAAHGTLTAGNATLNYAAYATLISMQAFDSYGGTQAVVQTWQITGIGSIGNSTNSTVQVFATIETPRVPANSYAAFATGTTCGAMTFNGDVTINSYDSTTTVPGSSPTEQNYGGHVGTNGNLYIGGHVNVMGNLSTPRTGVGTCTDGAVTALTETGVSDVAGSMIQLPASVSYPPPVLSAVPPTTLVTIDAALLSNAAVGCATLGLELGVNCEMDAFTHTVTVNGHGSDVTLPSVDVGATYKLVFVGHSSPPANVNINSLTATGGGQVQVDANMTGGYNESVVLKVAGKNPDSTDMDMPIELSADAWRQNSPNYSYDASTLQIAYGGTGTISMYGNDQSAATIYAPNANFILQGTTDMFGSILAKTLTNGGNASIHYDRRLLREFYVAGHPMGSTFSWQRN